MAVTVLTDDSSAVDSHTLSWTIPTLAVGDVIVVAAATWDQADTLGVPSGTGLSFTQRATVNQSLQCHVYIWTAVASAGGTNVVVTSTTGSSNIHSGALYRFPTADGYSLAGTPNTYSGFSASNSAPSGSITSTAGSYIVAINADWNGTTGTITYTGSAVEDGHVQSSTNSGQYQFHYASASASSTSIGMSSPTGQRWAMCAIEILAGSGTNSYSYTAAGGVNLSGASVVLRARTKVAAGGVQLAGTSSQVRKISRTAAGGVTLSGIALFAKGRQLTAAGGLSLSGAAAQLRARVAVPSGGIQLSGSASYSNSSSTQSYSYVAAGGLLLAGAAAVLRKTVVAASGGIQLGGASAINFFVVGATSIGRRIGTLLTLLKRR